ncbi:MAG TPA: inositol monophosphatase family protein [Gemmatimonadaceae bacterium]
MSEPNAVLLEAVWELAELTGQVAMRYFQRAIEVEFKADGSEVTLADREAERTAREWIGRRFPNDGIVGEEFGASAAGGARRWFIDPIDGTRSFVRGVPLWGSMVAVAEGEVVLAGAIACPAAGELVAAAVGEGCWHNDARATVSSVSSLERATILTTDQRFRHHPARAARWQALATQVGVARTWGDCYGYVLVATGRAELMVDDRLSPWDAAPLVPIIGEAGGVLSDWRDQRGIIGTDAIASNARLADVFRRALAVPESPS